MTLQWPDEFPGALWIDDEETQAVMDVLSSGSVFRYYGPKQPQYVTRLEERAKEYYGRRYALAVGSGTGGLFTTMLAMGIGPGDEVIVPSFMWVATISAVVQANAIPVLCEVDDSFNMDPDDLAARITPRTRAIIAVHMAGAPCDMERIMKVADDAGVAVIEDCAQCNGGEFQGRKVGTFGRMGIFSFQINKNITAGEGGLMVTDDEELYVRAVAAHDVGVPWVGAEPVPREGYNLWGGGRRMSELIGAVASVQLGKLPGIVAHMRESNRRMAGELAGAEGIELRRLNDPAGDTGPFLVLMLPDAERAIAAAGRMRQAGLAKAVRLADYGLHIYFNIDALVGKVPLSPAGNPWSLEQNAESVYEYGRGACPRSDALFDRSVLVPIPSRLTPEQETAAAAVIRQVVEETA